MIIPPSTTYALCETRKTVGYSKNERLQELSQPSDERSCRPLGNNPSPVDRPHNPSSTDTGPLTPSTGTRRGGGEDSLVWARGLTCTRNNWFSRAGAREPWLFSVLWVLGGVRDRTRESGNMQHVTFSGTISQHMVSGSHHAGGSHIVLETGDTSPPHVWHRTLSIDVPTT